MNTTKIALITGANRGLGWEITNQLALNGYKVYAGVRNLLKSESAYQRFENKGQIQLIHIDMENKATFQEAFDLILKEEGHLDLLVNNAGVMLDGDLMIDSTTTIKEDLLKLTFDINFFAVVALTNKMIPLLEKSNLACIVNVSSQMGSIGLHAQKAIPAKTFAYNASKAALNAYTVHLANSLEPQRIKVNSVHPGWMNTDMGGIYAPMTANQGAQSILKIAMLEPSGPSGKFFHEENEILW